jgi:hypothetical protein
VIIVGFYNVCKSVNYNIELSLLFIIKHVRLDMCRLLQLTNFKE